MKLLHLLQLLTASNSVLILGTREIPGRVVVVTECCQYLKGTYYTNVQALWFLTPPQQRHMITLTQSFVNLCISLHCVLLFPTSRKNEKTIFFTSPHPRPAPCTPPTQPNPLVLSWATLTQVAGVEAESELQPLRNHHNLNTYSWEGFILQQHCFVLLEDILIGCRSILSHSVGMYQNTVRADKIQMLKQSLES